MTRENLAFMIGGLAFGLLIGFGTYQAIHTGPSLSPVAAEASEAFEPRGPRAPTQAGPTAEVAAPMMAEINGLKRRLQESPDDDQVLLRLANLYYDAAMWERAAGYYERVAKLIPDDPDLLTDLGVCYKELRRYDDALASFDRAHGLDATHWQSLYNTVVVAGFDLNRIDVALRALELIESIDPQPAELGQGRMERLREMVQGLASTAREPT